MALDFVEGKDLLELIEEGGKKPSPAVLEAVLRKVLGAVSFIHDQGILHRDISPDNILLDQNNDPVLIDFGAAREQATKQSRILSALRVVKDGYSPQEFYIAGSEQGPYSDLYALGATFYHLLTDDLPPNSQARLSAVASGDGDPYEPLVGRVSGYSTDFLMAVDKSLEILPKDRIGSAQDWIDMMDGKYEQPAKVVSIDTAKAKGAEEAKPKSKKGMFLATAAAIGVLAIGVATQTDLLKSSGPAETEVVSAPATVSTPVTSAPAVSAPVAEAETILADVVDQPIAEPVIENSVVPEVSGDAVVADAVEPSAEDAASAIADIVAAIEAAEQNAIANDVPDVDPSVEVVADTPAATSDTLVPDADIAVVEPIAPEATSEALAPDADIAVVDPVEPTPEVIAPEVVVVLAPAKPTPAELLNIEPPVSENRKPLSERLADLLPEAPITRIADVEPAVSESRPPLSDQLASLYSPIDAQSDINATISQPAINDTVVVSVPQETAPSSVKIAAALPNTESAPQIASIDTTPAEPTPVPEPEPEELFASSVEVAGIETARSVLLPFDGFFAAQEGETRIYAVNGVTVANREEFDRVVAELLTSHTGTEAELQVRVGLRATTAEDQLWKLPVVYRTRLSNGLVFDAAPQDNGWITKVADVPDNLSLELETGDQIFGYLGTNELLAEPTSMSDILMREVVQGTTVFHFAVKRGASTWAAAFPFEASENN